MYLAVNALLTHAPGDQLRVLGAKIEDENEFVVHFVSIIGSAAQPGKRANYLTSKERVFILLVRFSGGERHIPQ